MNYTEKTYMVQVYHIEYDNYQNDIPDDLPTEMIVAVIGDKNDDEDFPEAIVEAVEEKTGYDVIHIEYVVLD